MSVRLLLLVLSFLSCGYGFWRDSRERTLHKWCAHHADSSVARHRCLRMLEYPGYELPPHAKPFKHTHRDRARRDMADPHPMPLTEDALKWMTPRDKIMLANFKRVNPSRWSQLQKLGDLYFHARKDQRKKSKEALKEYCTTNLKALLGPDSFEELKEVVSDGLNVEKIEAKFTELTGSVENEKDRLNAEHYGLFCRRVFRLMPYKPMDITSWLTARQKFQIGEMIQDPDVGDAQVYAKVFEFYKAINESHREDAREIIESGCRRFIAHVFGDEVEEEIDISRSDDSVPKQRLAALLVTHAEKIHDVHNKKLVSDSMPICTRIYLGYDYSCFCNGHSRQCHASSFRCEACGDNTHGVQCEKCIHNFEKNAEGRCVPKVEFEAEPKTLTACSCNGHASECDDSGKCIDCQHNTTGDDCSVCLPGFYGDPLEGSANDCVACPCPNNGNCKINEDRLIQCTTCPAGLSGNLCEIQEGQKVQRFRHRRRYHNRRY